LEDVSDVNGICHDSDPLICENRDNSVAHVG
jgi:hypothetical protein